MFPNLTYDFRRVYTKSAYRGKLRRIFFCLWSQGFQAIAGYRISRWLVLRHIPGIYLIIQRVIEITTGISLPPEAQIGKGLRIPHFGGIIVHSDANIGNFCTISHGVTIGNQKPGGKSPRIGNNVFICADAKVLGDISIGDNCIIGTNAVVLESMPDNSIIAGMPARVVKKIENKEAYREFYYEA